MSARGTIVLLASGTGVLLANTFRQYKRTVRMNARKGEGMVSIPGASSPFGCSASPTEWVLTLVEER